MWKFYLVYYSDMKVDVIIGIRYYLGDYVIWEVFVLFGVIVFGILLVFYLFYCIVIILFIYFMYVNIIVLAWLDKLLSLLFIMFNMYKFYYYFEWLWIDFNYGNIFLFWDCMFGIFVYDDFCKVCYGVDVFSDDLDENVGY